MSNLLVRSISSVFFVLLILGPLFLADWRIAYALYTVLGGATLFEILRLARKTGSEPHVLYAFSLYIGLVFHAYWLANGLETPHWLWLLIGGLSLMVFVSELFRSHPMPLESLGASVLAPVFVSMSFLGLTYFYVYRSDLPTLYLSIAVFAVIWINDAGAYLVGRKWGRTKLYERLSPNKTREGSLGGLVLAMAAGYGMSTIPGMPSTMIMMGFAATTVVFGSLGDLFESRIKRAAEVKDSGRFLPGHGGFFDRFDAMMLAIPAAILYFEAVLPKPLHP